MTEILFNGPDGRLDGRYHHSSHPNAPVALILHPDPRHGGTMNNRVVYTLFQSFAQRGFSVLRFNFRGVGRSQGHFDNGQGELSDAASALDWLQTHNPNASVSWVAGFSFGAWVGMQLLMRRPELDGFVSIAPTASVHDFSFLAPCPSSGLIVHGTHDNLVPEESASRLAAKLSLQKNIQITYRQIEGANHFFGEHLELLKDIVDEYLMSVKIDGGMTVDRDRAVGE